MSVAIEPHFAIRQRYPLTGKPKGTCRHLSDTPPWTTPLLGTRRGGEEARDVRGESPLARLKERYVQERMERLQKLCPFGPREMRWGRSFG